MYPQVTTFRENFVQRFVAVFLQNGLAINLKTIGNFLENFSKYHQKQFHYRVSGNHFFDQQFSLFFLEGGFL
jgi:hypothetical protein